MAKREFQEWNACTLKQKVERWEQLKRVLKALTPHERRKHFDMGTWGYKTACGTVACAAGHAGMDPWFRRRGLRLKVGSGVLNEFPLMHPREFFGGAGTDNVFLTPADSVREVIGNVNRHLERIRHGWE